MTNSFKYTSKNKKNLKNQSYKKTMNYIPFKAAYKVF